MKRLIAISIIAISLGCTNVNDFNKGKQQLENQGYTNVTNTGYSYLCCGEDDMYSNGFTATDKQGNQVEGCICSGLLKGVTVRF